MLKQSSPFSVAFFHDSCVFEGELHHFGNLYMLSMPPVIHSFYVLISFLISSSLLL